MKSKHLRVLGTAFFALLATASLAHAQATRTWVSGVGDDANPCSRTAPCKTFAGAIAKTAPCGEIDVLDPGGFGALTITKCISIEADGVIAGVLVSGTNGFVVAAGTGDNVMIRGLTFEGLGTGLNGIRITQAGKVKIENCYIDNFTQFGIDFEPDNAGAQLTVERTEIRNTGNF
ncbi:MAG: right-handed parallel beta-helix repeat-containing protein, partial [Acidobacteria bacterium]|nr:right-handed parallel beta-helix repeat-containing protein [Acidobacteriota bacterium]